MTAQGRIFISHSSVNNAAALAVAKWLADNGWDDYFLDVAPRRGLAPGERWQEALKAAADRCEAVLFLISPAWRDSPYCRTEFQLAKLLGKTIFGVLIEATPLDTLPPDITAEWQLCDLVTGAARVSVRVSHDPLVPDTDVSLSLGGLDQLKDGLQKAGLDASTFPWPPPNDPDRSPYRGLKALEAEDAAVFFGRDAAIVRGLDTLRGLRARRRADDGHPRRVGCRQVLLPPRGAVAAAGPGRPALPAPPGDPVRAGGPQRGLRSRGQPRRCLR